MTRGRAVRGVLGVLLAGALTTAGALGWIAWKVTRTVPLPPLPAPATFSWFALGDTGTGDVVSKERLAQLVVGRTMATLDHEARVDALLFLGDNFYPTGLLAREIETRIRHNVVDPYCGFVAFKGPLSPRVAGGCHPVRGRDADAPALLAVLGNHDKIAPESPRLERQILPLYVSNWKLPADAIHVEALAPGLQLLMVDADVFSSGLHLSALADAAAKMPGPWRVLATHRPLQPGNGQAVVNLTRALARTGLRFQLVLAGHEHSLGVATLPAPHGLQVISGGGAKTRRPLDFAGRLLAVQQTGFARIDFVRAGGEDARLFASLYSVPLFGRAARIGTWSVGVDNDVRREDRAGEDPAPDSR